jgi:glycosyltransferase involved in cell wall biosynthesis
MIEAGFDPDTLTCKPNFLMEYLDVGLGEGGYVLYLGRLSPEKGIATLIEAWDHDGVDVPLRIIGTGPMKQEVEALAAKRPAVQYLGYCPWPAVADEMRNASLLAFPSVNYEGMPMTLLEAMQVGLPVLGSRLGAIPEIVLEGQTGRCFDAGDADALRQAAREMMSDPARLSGMRKGVRRHYETNYAPEQAYHRLMAVYDKALSRRYAGSTQTEASLAAHSPKQATAGLAVGKGMQ